MSNIINIFLILTLCLTFLFSSSIALAQPNSDPKSNIDPNTKQGRVNTINIGNQLPKTNMGVPAQAGSGIIGTLLSNVILLLFTIGGIATLIYFIWGAVDWITSGGEKDKVASARKKMTNAIIGLVLLSLSYFIVSLVGEVVGFNPLGNLEIRSLGEQPE